ncbi:MAG TPA: nicotinate (nicotinamide) nucleotide adenylyltransferase [Chitinophagaceae bacterium]|nr:nicotinate (nicotinamide) nucleotide adenylyltransferase [Chitinophagaceae bacterium]
MRIGLYFGSFNPIHHGHLIIANHTKFNSDLQEIWFVVSPQNPLKQNISLLNEYHRLALVQLAIQNEPGLKAQDIEFRLPRPSYTIDTITYLQEKYPDHQFSILMGSDSYTNLPKWKNYEQLLARCEVFVYTRPGFETRETFPNSKTIFIDAPLLDISATHIRKMISEGKSIRYFVPDAVKDEIERNSYYRNHLPK